MLRAISLVDFKSFASQRAALAPFTLLVGPNASGKSNLLDAVRFLHGLGHGWQIRKVLDEVIEGGQHIWSGIRGGTKEVIRNGANRLRASARLWTDAHPSGNCRGMQPKKQVSPMAERRRHGLGLAIALTIATFGCHSPSSADHDAAPAAHGAAHWSYDSATGPAHWGDLDPAYSLCETGTCQSPIDIVGARAEDLPNIEFGYERSRLNIVNNGHTVQVNYDPDSHITLDGKRYQLLQFHFHAPSEHRIAGASFEAELHLVHQAADGALAVVGLLIQRGRDNPALDTVCAHFPAAPGPEQRTTASVDAASLLPPVRTTYRYGGSLTTPPCSEDVSWNIMSTPIEMSADQLAAFTRLYHGNNRPVQPLASRVIIEDITP